MKITLVLLMSLLFVQLYACNKNNPMGSESKFDNITNADTMKLKIIVSNNVFNATLYSNATAKAFKEKLPMRINMNELNGNEKYFDLTGKFPVNESNPDTINPGDIMLYGSNTLVLFYKGFSTSYKYSRIGKVENPAGLAAALGKGNVMVEFELE